MNRAGKAKSVLVVDDDSAMRELVCAILSLEGFEVSLADGNDAALDAIDARPFDLVITDLLMPGRSGLETISGIRGRDAALPILAISGGGRVGASESLHTARCLGANATLAKPFGHRDLLSRVSSLLPLDSASLARDSASLARDSGLPG
jgi:DNA-binding response OmpR family regulator